VPLTGVVIGAGIYPQQMAPATGPLHEAGGTTDPICPITDGHDGPGAQAYVVPWDVEFTASVAPDPVIGLMTKSLSSVAGLMVLRMTHELTARRSPRSERRRHAFASLFADTDAVPMSRMPQMTSMMTASTPAIPTPMRNIPER